MTYRFQQPLIAHYAAKADGVTASKAEAPSAAPSTASVAQTPTSAPGDAVVIAKRRSPVIEGLASWGRGMTELVAAVIPGAGVLATGVAMCLPAMTGTSIDNAPWIIGGGAFGFVGGAMIGMWQQDTIRNLYSGAAGALKAMGYVLLSTTLPVALAGFGLQHAFGTGAGLAGALVVGAASTYLGETIAQAKARATA